MRLTTKGRYAVTAMLDLAIYSQQKPVSLADISARQSISLSYLEQLFSKLRKAGLVKSVRGPGGGYVLGNVTETIHVAAIIEAVDESVDVTGCGGRSDCQGGKTCLTHHLWEDLSLQIYQFLASISLADLIERNEVQALLALQSADNNTKKIPLKTVS